MRLPLRSRGPERPAVHGIEMVELAAGRVLKIFVKPTARRELRVGETPSPPIGCDPAKKG